MKKQTSILAGLSLFAFATVSSAAIVYSTDFRDAGGDGDRQGWHFMRAHTVSFEGESGMTVLQDTSDYGSLQLTFPDVTLDVGDWMEVSFKFNLNADVIPSGFQALRMGVFNHNGRFLTSDVTNDPLWSGDTGFNSNNTGYWAGVSMGTTTDSAQFRYQGVEDNFPLNLNNLQVSPHFRSNEPPLPLNDNVVHDIRLRLDRVDAEEYNFTVDIGAFSVVTAHTSDAGGFTDTYNTFILFTNSVPAGDFSSDNNRGYTIDDFTIEVIPEPRFYAVLAALAAMGLILVRRRR